MGKKRDHEGGAQVYNVLDYGAAANKDMECRTAIQQAIDDCSQCGGGTVYFPAGQYTSGTIHLRSCVRIHIESGAFLFASKDKTDFKTHDRHSVFKE